jgi:dienelactone hydrolase
MKPILIFLFSVLSFNVFSQINKSEDAGFRHFQTIYQNDTIDILVKSKMGEEQIRKPLFFFCQGSLPQPLIITHGKSCSGGFPFNIDSLSKYFHLAIVSKPFIPLVVPAEILKEQFCYKDSKTGLTPSDYTKRNLLEYYVDRNLKVIDFLQLQSFVNKNKLVVAGHSQGSRIAVNMCAASKKITHLIYSAGNPFGQIAAMIPEARAAETSDSTEYTEGLMDYWKDVINDNQNMKSNDEGDTKKATYQFSQAEFPLLMKLEIPILVSYGTKDVSSIFNDYLRVETIAKKKKNFTFKSYIGLEHNFFGLKNDGRIDNEKFGWDRVANDWNTWLKGN